MCSASVLPEEKERQDVSITHVCGVSVVVRACQLLNADSMCKHRGYIATCMQATGTSLLFQDLT